MCVLTCVGDRHTNIEFNGKSAPTAILTHLKSKHKSAISDEKSYKAVLGHVIIVLYAELLKHHK